MNNSGAVGDILVFTFINLSDNTVYTQNRKYRYSESSSSSSSSKMLWGSPLGLDPEYITIMVMNMPRSGSEYARF